MELLTYWKIIKKRLLLILLLVIAAEFGALYYVQSQVPVYSSTITLIITPSSLGTMAPYEVNLALGPLANTYIEFMRTWSFASQVAERMPVQISAEEVLRSVYAEFQRDTQIFRITGTHHNPEVAQALANTMAQMLIETNTERQRTQQQARLAAQRSPEAIARQEQMSELVTVLQDELSYYDDQVRILNDEIRVLEQGPQSVETTQRILALRDELLQIRAERIDVLASLAETQNAMASAYQEPEANVDTVVVVDPAPLPEAPVGRDVAQPLVAALVGALAAGVGLAWLLDYLDNSIRRPEELDEFYGMPSQGAIARMANSGADARANSLATLTDPRSPVAEAFRSLRTSIRMAGAQAPTRTLLVTSAGPGEGKTFVAANLAIAFAQEGRRVLLVDLDLRKPQVHTTFGLRREPGFSNLVVERDLSLDSCVQRTQVPNLLVICAGTIPPHPAELLGSQRAAEVIQQLNQTADIVIYDSAPAATVTDSVLVAPQVDGVLQVVGAGGTRRDAMLRCKALLERAGARILGPVLNWVQAEDLGYYRSYYQYGGYYHEEAAKPSFWRWFGGSASRRSRQPAHTLVQPRPANQTTTQRIVSDGRPDVEPLG